MCVDKTVHHGKTVETEKEGEKRQRSQEKGGGKADKTRKVNLS